MDDEKLYNVLIVVSIIGIFAILALIFFTDSSEPFTELYFEDHQSLPKSVQKDETYNFQFSIVNHEGELKQYTVKSYALYDDNLMETLGQSVVSIEDQGKTTMAEQFSVTRQFTKAKVVVELDSGEEIHFWIKEEQ